MNHLPESAVVYSAEDTPRGDRATSALPYLAHLLPLAWLFGSVLAGARVLFLRDMLVTYRPDYAVLERALAQGVWPLWNPHAYTGTPFLKAYPLDLVLVGLMGTPGALSLGVVAHLFLAMCGMTWLARREGVAARGSWLAGTVYGLSGLMLSMVTLLQSLQAAAWAPWVVGTFLGWVRQPTWPRAARLALLAALQVSTLSAEIAAQTLLAGLALAASGTQRPRRRHLVHLAGAGLLALLLATPALFGAVDLVEGTRRAGAFLHWEVLALSANGPVLVEALLPRFFGSPLWYAEAGGWAQPYFPGGVPYFVSAYLGPGVLGLALLGGSTRLWALALLGVLLGLGEHGPFAAVLSALTFVRFPVKYLFLSTFALALLAGRGLDRVASHGSRARWLAMLPGSALLVAGAVVRIAPQRSCALASALWPPLVGAGEELTCQALWPEAWFVSGVLGTAVVLLGVSRFAAFAAPLLALDLLIVNGPVNPLVPRNLLLLEGDVQALAETVRSRPGAFRLFSYGIALSAGHRWDLTGQGNQLIAMHRLMRQSLTPPTQVIDRLDGAFDVARTGWEPVGSTLPPDVLHPDRLPDIYRELRLAGVGFVLSFEPLVADPPLADLVGEARLAGVLRPLRLYALRDALPRAFWVPRCESDLAAAAGVRARAAGFDPRQSVVIEGDGPCGPSSGDASARARVELRRLGPHHVRVEADTPPGWLVVLERYHRNWRARYGSDDVRLFKANGQFWAVATRGGARTVELSYEPVWLPGALTAAGLGLLATVSLSLAPLVMRRARDRPRSARAFCP